MKSNAEIQQDVLTELRLDTRVSETEVSVELDEGIVTLTGTVDTYTAKLAAVEAAHRVAGVLDVADDIQVRATGGRSHPSGCGERHSHAQRRGAYLGRETRGRWRRRPRSRHCRRQ